MLLKLCILFGGLFSFKTYTIHLTQTPLVQRRLPLCRYACCGVPLSQPWGVSFTYDQRVIRCLAKNWQAGTLLPPSDVCVRNFLYLFYTLIKLCYTRAPSGQARWLAPDGNPLWRPRIPAPGILVAHSHNLSITKVQNMLALWKQNKSVKKEGERG